MFIRIISTFCVALLFAATCLADPSTDAIQRKAEENARALEKGDFETIVKNTYPKLIEMVGDKDKMLAGMKQATQDMASKGFHITSVTVGTPSPTTTAGNKMYSIVPTVMVATTPEDKITQNSFLLAISTDKGSTWYFLDGSGINSDNILQIIPDFPDSVKLPFPEPAKEEPILHPKTATP